MDKLYSINYLKNLTNDILTNKISSSELTTTLQNLVVTDRYDNIENNAYLLAIYTLLKNNANLTALDALLLEEIHNQVIFSLIKIDAPSCEKAPEKTSPPCINSEPKEKEFELSIYQGVPSERLPDLNDNEAVKAFFLMKNTFLANPDGNFNYPSPGNTAIITSGDNMTIPGVRYMVNYEIDHEGNVVGIKGYPERVLERTSYEDIYKGLIGKLFDDKE